MKNIINRACSYMTTDQDFEIDITLQDERWRADLPDIEAWTQKLLSSILSKQIPQASHVEVSIVLSDDDFVQDLNKTYRHQDKPTNVLSFPQTSEDMLDITQPFISLGDIIIAYETIKKEAEDQGKTFADHYSHMLVHGGLHLLHYDHQTDAQAQEMESLEIKILDDFGIKNPYAEL